MATQKYWPYGATRSGGITQTDKLYTGQQAETGDSALGLYNYKARFYSTVLGRFLSVDPIVGHANDPQSWNPYTYVRNNPLGYVDPTGKRECATDACDPASSAAEGLLPTGTTCDMACGWKLAWAGFNPTPEPQAAALPELPAVVLAAPLPACPGPSCGIPISPRIGLQQGIADICAALCPAAVRAAPVIEVYVGLPLLGMFSAPCDSKGCTTRYAKDVKEQRQNPPTVTRDGKLQWDEKRQRWVDDGGVYTYHPSPHDKRGGGPHHDYGPLGPGPQEWSPDGGVTWYPK